MTIDAQPINSMLLNSDTMVEAEDLQSLKTIGLLGGCRRPIWLSSQTFGKTLDISPQTASRRLISLERQQLIIRSMKPDGQYVAITKKGEEELKLEYADYIRIFNPKSERYILTGTVISGLGEGRYYMSIPYYKEQFAERLGFEPFPGTLNVRLDPASIQIRKEIDTIDWIDIRGFTTDNRTFGGAKSLPCRIDGHTCAIVVPSRTHYPEDIIEIIAGCELRTSLNLKDNDYVEVEISHDK
jgi:riboflavin kinase